MVTSRLSVYERLLGSRYEGLPAAVQAFHRLSGTVHLSGEVTVRGAETLSGQLAAAMMRLPKPAPSRPFSFLLTTHAESESWTRLFQARSMTSSVASDGGLLTERVAVLTLWYELDCAHFALTMKLIRLTVFGFALPMILVPKVHASEHGLGKRFHFDVAVHWPRDRRLISYTGHLDLPSTELSQ